MGELYLYRAPLDWLAQRLVAASAHPIRSRSANQPPGLTPQRVTLRWAPAAGGAIRTHRGLLWTSHQTPMALLAYQQSGAEAFLQFRPVRRQQGESRLLQDCFPAPIAGPVSATAHLANERLTIRGRVGQIPFLRQLAAPDLQPGRWALQARIDRGQVRLTLGPPDRPPLGARILSFRGCLEQPSAQTLATGHVSITATLAMEAEWLDKQGRRRVTDWQIQLRHLLRVIDATPGELLGIRLELLELKWAPDCPVWALLRAEIAHYRPSFFPIEGGSAPVPVMTHQSVVDFAWTEAERPGADPETRRSLIPFDRPIARLIALELRQGALDLIVGLKGGGLHLLTVESPWRRSPPTLTAFALPGQIRLEGRP